MQKQIFFGHSISTKEVEQYIFKGILNNYFLDLILSGKVLESRREDLEKYLQCLAKVCPLPEELLEFLELENFNKDENKAGTKLFI